MNSTQIQAMVRNMDESLRRHKRLRGQSGFLEKIATENKVLFEEYPSIFKLHMEGKLDETFFYMLQLKRKIEKGELTEDQASIMVGQKLFNRYVDPVIKKEAAPVPMSYEEYYKQYK